MIGPGEIAGAARARARGDRDDGARRPRLHGDDLGQRRAPKGVLHAQRAAWARRMMWEGWYGLGARRPHAPRRRLQLDLHPRRRADRPAGGGGDGADLHRAGRPPRLAGARRRARGDALRRGAGRLSPDARRAGARRGLRRRPPRPQRRRGAARGGARGVERGHGPADPRGARHVGDLDLRLGLPARPAPPGTTGFPQPGRRVAILPDDGGAEPVARGEDGLLAVSRRDPA